MKTLVFAASFLFISMLCFSQSVIGSWQLAKQTDCNQEVTEPNKKFPQTLHFKDAFSGEESAKMLNTSKASNTKSFLYKIDETTLYILDKKSRMIVDSYNIDTLEADSLILSNTTSPCTIRVFIKAK
jgi:hypothetical protein